MSLNNKPYLPRNWPDYIALEAIGVIPVGRSNQGARWLQEHRNDPYWIAHERCIHAGDYDFFTERWEEVRETLGFR